MGWCSGGWCKYGWCSDGPAGNIVTVNMTLPAFGLSGTVLSGNAVAIDMVLPAFDLSGAILAGNAVAVNMVLPPWEMTGAIAQGNLVAIDMVLPAFQFATKIVGGNLVTVDMVLPAWELDTVLRHDNLIAVDMILPAFECLTMIKTAAVGDVTYQGIVMNIKNRAVSEYTNYPFNSIIFWDGKYYGLNESGLFLLEGDDDDGDEIEAYIKSGTFDINQAQPLGGAGQPIDPSPYKYPQEAWVSGSGEMYFELTSDKDGAFVYAVTGDRAEVGRGFEGRFYTMKMKNKKGGAFNLNQIRMKTANSRVKRR